jgi:hypothetical protein
MSDDLQIKIKTTADTTGAKAAASSLGDVSAAAGKGAVAAKDQAKGFSQLGEQAEKGAAAGRVLGEVMRGNVLALGQLGPVLKAVGEAFKTNPLFLIGSIAATIILPVFAKISEGWKKQAADAKAAGDAVDESMQRARDAIAKKADNALAKTYDEIAEAAARAERYINAVTTARTAQTDANEAVALAQIDANTSLSNEEKLLAKVKVQEDARRARAATQLDILDAKDTAAAKTAAETTAAIDPTRRQEANARTTLQRVQARSPEAIKRELEENFRAEKSGNLKGDKIPELFQRRADLNAELARAEDTYAAQLKPAQDALAAATAKRIAAEEKAAEATAKAAEEKGINDLTRQTVAIQTAGASKVAEITTTAALPAAQAADARRQQAEDDAAVRDGLLTNVTTGAQRAGRGILAIGREARAAGNTEIAAAAKRALDAANATRDGTTEAEAGEIAAAFQALEAALAAKNQESASLKALVKGIAAQVNQLAGQQKTSAKSAQ